MRRPIFLLLFATLPSIALAGMPPVQRGVVGSRAAATFDRADTNHDGLLSRAEYQAAILAYARRFDPKVPATGKGMDVAMTQYDVIAQGRTGGIPRAAFIDAALAHFDGADLNHDGVVTPEEARKAGAIKQKAFDKGR
jgi:hypothetical protein